MQKAALSVENGAGLRVRVRGGAPGGGVFIGADLHLRGPEGVLPARPAGPLHAVGVGGVASPQVLPVEVGGVAVAVPPRPLVVRRTVVLRLVLVPVFGGELHPRMLKEGVP